MTLEEIGRKDVIQSLGGENLGRIDDVEIDPEQAKVTAVVLRGRPKLFGLLGYGPDLVIPWERICSIGADVVMVQADLGEDFQPRRRGGHIWNRR